MHKSAHCAASFRISTSFYRAISSRLSFLRVTYERHGSPDATSTNKEDNRPGGQQRSRHRRPDDGPRVITLKVDEFPRQPGVTLSVHAEFVGKCAGRNCMHTRTHYRLDMNGHAPRRRGSRFVCNTCLSTRRDPARPGAVTHIFMEQRVANTVSSSSTRYRQVHLLPRVLSTLTRTTDRIITWNATSSTKSDELCKLRCWRRYLFFICHDAESGWHCMRVGVRYMIFKIWNFYLKFSIHRYICFYYFNHFL